jgi:hypothetical protein
MVAAMLIAGSAAAGALLGGFVVPRGLAPSAAARLSAFLATAAALSFVWMLVLAAGSGLAQVHGVAERLTWCNSYVASHRETIAPLSLLALGALSGVTVSAVVARRRQRALRARRDAGALAVLTSDEPTAFVLPGRPGQIVVTTGMLRSLDADERRVLLEHELAHLRLRHHRYVRAAQLATAVLPILGPVLAKVRFATERWADEEAARVVGDRALVARAIARAALVQPRAPAGALSFNDSDAVARVEAMLTEPVSSGWPIELWLGAAVAAFLAATFTSVLFVHHWLAAVFGYCG